MTISESGARVGAVVLAGGAGQRLGIDKASIDWHGTPLVERVARLAARALGGGPVVVVGPAAGSGNLPPLPEAFKTATDPTAHKGPLVGLLAGLDELQGMVEAVVAVPCDLPLLHPVTIRALLERLLAGSYDCACPIETDSHPLPLPGAWRASSAEPIRNALAAGERSPARVARSLSFAAIPLADLASDELVREADPNLDSLLDIDTPEDLERLRDRPPKIRVSRGGRVETTTAWTLGGLVAATDCDLNGPCVVNGLPVEFDPRFPLARRDAVSLPESVQL